VQQLASHGGEDKDDAIATSPKDVKRSSAGQRRLLNNAESVAEALAESSNSQQNETTAPSRRVRRNLARLSRYARWGDDVKGFFEPGLLQLYLAIDTLHEKHGITGALAEIGVYHGKSFIPLALLRQPCERELCVAVDCFFSQEFNRDQSGEGDRVAFERNVAAAMHACCEGEAEDETEEDGSIDDDDDDDDDGGGGSALAAASPGRRLDGGGALEGGWLRVLEADSVTLSPLAVSTAVGGQPVRLFSIDGCHTAEATAADLTTASANLHPGGAVVVDDAFNADWPGVMTGLTLNFEP
jgi:hypothetical protein